MVKVIISFLLLYSSLSIRAQTNGERYSEAEITVEKEFIEAKKYKLLGDFDTANELFRQILKKYRNHDAAAFELAESYNREGKLEDALHHINLAIANDTGNKWYLLLKAKILKNAKKFVEAASVYDVLIGMQPDHLQYLEHKAFMFRQAGDLSMAIEVLDVLDAKIGTNEKTAMIKHDLYDQMGKKAKAIEVLEDLIKLFPGKLKYRHDLAGYYKKIDKKKQANQVYRDILSIDPSDARANVALAENYKDDGKSGDYLSAIRSVIEDRSVAIDLKIAELMPYVTRLQKDKDRSIIPALLDLIRTLERVHPDDAKPYALHGDILSLTGDHTGALEKYKTTISIDESNYLVWEQMLMTQVELGLHEDLFQTSNQALEIFPNKAMLYYLNGLGGIGAKRYVEAIDGLEQALFMVGRDKEMQFNILALLGNAFYRSQQYDASTDAYDKALMLKPNEPRVLNDYSYQLAERGERLPDATLMIEKALAKTGTDPRFLATQAWIYFRQQKMEIAKTAFEKSIKHGGDGYAYIIEKYGDVLYALDQPEKALKQWKLAREKGEGSKWLDRKIAERKLIEAQ